MFKKLFNKPNKNEQERGPAREKQGQMGQSNGFEEIPERPFDINLDELWEYEFEELHEFIKHYEQFSNYVRNKYNDLLNEFLFVQEKLGLLDKERRRLMTENEQYKVHIEDLKRCLDERSPSGKATNVGEVLTTKLSTQKTEEAIQSTVETDPNEDDAIHSLRSRAEKLLNELRAAEEPICHNILGLLAEQAHSNNHKNHQTNQTEEDEEKEHGNNSEEAGSRALDTENNEGLDSARVHVDGNTERESKGVSEANLKEAVANSLGQALKRIGKEVGNIFEGYSEIYGKTKQKEKELIIKIKNEAINKTKNEEYEKELKDVRGKLNQVQNALNETRTELDNKSKLLEKTKMISEENLTGALEERQQYEQLVTEREKEIEELHQALEEYKETILKDEKEIEKLEGERDQLYERLELVEKEYQMLTKNKDKVEKDNAQEAQKYQKNLQLIEEDKKKNEKKLQRIEADRNDIENSLIQEKLKHHQTQADLVKAKEKIEEVQKNLNEETDARKADMRKYEEFKKRMAEMEKKEKENKKTIKALNEQVENKNREIQHLDEERRKFTELTQSNKDTEQTEPEDVVNHEALEKAGIINAQLTKIHHLEEKLEVAVKEVQILQKNSNNLQKEKDELAVQVKVLKEKRELGLQEIKKLTKMLDQTKTTDQNMSLSSVQSRTNIEFDNPSKPSGYFSPVTIGSPQSIASSRVNLEPENVKNLRKIKKGLDEVYKEIIMAITNEKLYESQVNNKATGKLGELVKGPLPSDNFMKIEKRMNDTIVMLQEFMENFE